MNLFCLELSYRPNGKGWIILLENKWPSEPEQSLLKCFMPNAVHAIYFTVLTGGSSSVTRSITFLEDFVKLWKTTHTFAASLQRHSPCDLPAFPPASCQSHVLWGRSIEIRSSWNAISGETDRQAMLVVLKKSCTFICCALSPEILLWSISFWALSEANYGLSLYHFKKQES